MKKISQNKDEIIAGKGQNVENQNVKSKKKNIESQKERQKSERWKSFLDFRCSDLFWCHR